MKRPSSSQKKVTAENLAALGAERLAEILVEVAETRADLKRRLRMELAAEQGVGPLAGEIDKRLRAFETSRGQIGWRQRPAFLRDLDALRQLIAGRLAPLDATAAVERLWRFLDTAPRLSSRYREREDELDVIFRQAAADLGRLLGSQAPGPAAASLVDSLAANPVGWKRWFPGLLAAAPASLAVEALQAMSERRGSPGWITLMRQAADAAGDVDAFRASYTAQAQATPSIAAEIASRLLAAGRTAEAGEVLRNAAPPLAGDRPAAPDASWESAWIDYLEAAGESAAAQEVRWASFERTLSADRARAFISRLADFEDVEAEARAHQLAAGHADFARGLAFLMSWPALPEAAGMIEARADDIQVAPEQAELWASRLRRRFPHAAQLLLRKAAAAAFRRRDYRTCDRLTAEAETIAC